MASIRAGEHDLLLLSTEYRGMMSREVTMPAAILQDLFRTRALDDFPGPFAHRARQVVRELRELWNQTSQNAAESRRIESLHSARDDYRLLLTGHIRLLEDYLALAELHRRFLGGDPLRVEELKEAVNELKALHDELFPRWQTADDLRQLLIDKFSLSADKLRELAATHPPAPSWAEETIDPFSD